MAQVGFERHSALTAQQRLAIDRDKLFRLPQAARRAGGQNCYDEPVSHANRQRRNARRRQMIVPGSKAARRFDR